MARTSCMRRSQSRASCVGARRRAVPRGGTTLLELMVVVLIILSITAITIPVVAPAVQARRTREAARLFTTFLNAARNRAIESGRPAGVWLERMPAYPEAVSNIFMAEVPPPYSGDFSDSQVACFVANRSGQSRVNVAFSNRNDTDWWNIVVPKTRTTLMVDAWANPDPLEQGMVREGDLIKIEGRDWFYTLKTVEMTIDGDSGAGGNRKWWYISRGRNGPTAEGGYYGGSEAFDWDGNRRIEWFSNASLMPRNYAIQTCNGLIGSSSVNGVVTTERSKPGLRYQIFRQPSKMQSGGIKLPEGIVLDLNFSGMSDGDVMRVTATSAAAAPSTGSYSNPPFHPRRDPNDTTFCPFWGDSLYPQDRSPILLVFSPGGLLDRVYCHRIAFNYAVNGLATNSAWNYQAVIPTGPLFFLVGKLDKIFPDEQYRTTQSADVNFQYQIKKNWLDLENLWVTIDPNGGLITSAMVDDIAETAQDPAIADVYKLRAQNPVNIGWARLNASRSRRSLGGK